MLRKTVLARALFIAFSTAALSAAVTAPALAQSNAAGNIFGRVDSPAGATVNLLNTDTGLRRSSAVESSGRYQVTALPPGHYRVELMRNGAVAATSEVDVIVGQGAEASFAAAGAEVQAVQITGRRNRIDVSNTNNGATFTARELKALPIAKSVDAIIQLAPNTTRADSRYEGGASFGGGGPSENAYYINGFPVTNPLTQLGASELPFGAIAQAQILTGGFGAEFGRSVGGVVNITTKSGTNNWEAGMSASVTPQSWRSTSRDYYFPVTGDPANVATDGKLRLRRTSNTNDGRTYGAYLGGPLIKDKLFMFVAGENLDNNTGTVVNSTAASAGSTAQAGWRDQKQQVRRFMGKLDWNITDNHRIEYTRVMDNTFRDLQLKGYNYASDTHNQTVASTQHLNNIGGNSGDIDVLKYTGNLTDNLTLTLLTGRSKTNHVNTYDGYDLNQKLYQVTQSGPGFSPQFNYTSPQFLVGRILPLGAADEIKSNRVDLEWKLGAHTVRVGLDDNKLSSFNAGDFNAGGGIWQYRKAASGASTVSLGGETVVVGAGAAPGSPASQGYYVREGIFNSATNTYSNQSAQFIEDKWQVTKNLLVTGGLRVEQMENLNGDKEKFLDVKNQIAPRLAASWDVNGDSSLKVFGSAGRYSVQIPTHISVRGASRSLNTLQYFTYTGVDSTGQPTGLKPLTSRPFSSNNEYYQKKDPLTVTADGIKPTYQDEVTLGFEKAFSPSLNFGAKATYRKLRSTIDDNCDPRPFDAYAARNKIDTSEWGGWGCASFNPGEDNTFLVDFHNLNPALIGKTHTAVVLTAADLGMPKAERTYTAVDLFAEHPLRNGWYGKLNYTWSRSKGNTEGQTLSDVAQTDVAATQTWDHPELMEGANGLLPNDRTHQLKGYGFYEVTPEWSLGGNFLLASGRPLNCVGEHPTLSSDYNYGSAYHYCYVSGTNKVSVPSPRGALGKLPTDFRVDLNVVYKPAFVKGFEVKLDVFNVFNKQIVQTIDEVQTNNAGTYSSTYGGVSTLGGYTAARSIRLGAEYNIKF
jgi:hypothetical protein